MLPSRAFRPDGVETSERRRKLMVSFVRSYYRFKPMFPLQIMLRNGDVGAEYDTLPIYHSQLVKPALLNSCIALSL